MLDSNIPIDFRLCNLFPSLPLFDTYIEFFKHEIPSFLDVLFPSPFLVKRNGNLEKSDKRQQASPIATLMWEMVIYRERRMDHTHFTNL